MVNQDSISKGNKRGFDEHLVFRQSLALRTAVPIGRSGWAIAAGYLGLFSLLLLPAPLALITGILGIRDIRRHPEKTGLPRCILGITLGFLGTILLVVGVLFVAT